MKISAAILTKNEEKNIEECIKTLGFFDEIIVVDDNSKDKTIQLINDLQDKRIKVFERSLDGDFSRQRNFASEKTTNNYVFFIDADERISKELEEELRLLDDSFTGYFVKRTDYMWGKELKYGESGNIYLLRLGNKEKGDWSGKVHEQWTVNGKTRKLRNDLKHFPHPIVNDFLTEINFYTDLRAKELFEKGVRSSFIKIIFYTKAKFIKDYIFMQGFRDGIPGFLMAIFMSFHSFLVRGKLWTLWNKNN